MEADFIQHLSLGLDPILIAMFLLTPVGIMVHIILRHNECISNTLSLHSLEHVKDFVLNDEVNQWATDHQFSHLGTYYLKTRRVHMFIATWIDPNKHTILSLIFCRTTSEQGTLQIAGLDFLTLFKSDISLCTSNNKSGHALPSPPKGYKEVFPGTPIDVLYKKHLNSMDYLKCIAKNRSGKTNPIKAKLKRQPKAPITVRTGKPAALLLRSGFLLEVALG